MKEEAFMPKVNLEEEDLKKLFEAVNEGYEPPGELIGKLFPSFLEKLKRDSRFDVEELVRHKIPTLEYAGKRQEGVILASASLLGQSAPLQVVRTFSEPGEDGWRNMIVQGDNLQFLKTVFLNQDPLIKDKIKSKVRLIYIDPPFATKADFQSKDGATSYSDKVESAEFLENLRERLIFMREILADDGSIYVHLDWKKGHYVKILMDEIFGEQNFRNEIARQTIFSHSDASQFGRNHDLILFYTEHQDSYVWNVQYQKYNEAYINSAFKSIEPETSRHYQLVSLNAAGQGPAKFFCGKLRQPPPGRHWAGALGKSIEELEKEGRIVISKNDVPRVKYYLDEMPGKVCQSIWTDVFDPQSQSDEKLDYPTQKPEALLNRIIKASSNPGDLVMDIFSGSGTTAAVAEKLGRRWIMCDFGKHAIYTMQKRLLNIAESKALGNENKGKKYGIRPKPFCVVSVGAYDFTRVMNLRKNKDAYISFVLALFGIPREDKDFVSKYRLDGIYAERDGDPVEIFPVWDDD